MSRFDRFVGIDYSGAQFPSTPLGNLRIFDTWVCGEPSEIRSRQPGRTNLSRNEVRLWLEQALGSGESVLVGIDHAFCLPAERLATAGLGSWSSVLDHFVEVVRTHERTVQAARASADSEALLAEAEPEDTRGVFRLTEKRVSGAKSVFDYIGPGVAFSTMAGIAQLAFMRRRFRELEAPVHFWPFDGFELPASGSVIVEIYPAIFSRQFGKEPGLNPDQHDARSAALWLREICCDGRLDVYLRPPLTVEQKKLAILEGWILGVM